MEPSVSPDEISVVQAAPFTPSPPGSSSSGVFPSKQMQNDEAEAPLDDQERRAVQKRLQRKADEKRAELQANGSLSVREIGTALATNGVAVPDDLPELCELIDFEGNGAVNLIEFVEP